MNTFPTSPENLRDENRVMHVGMKEYRVSSDEHPVLETEGLGPCIGIAIFDNSTKVGQMAHIAIPMFEQPTIDQMLQEMHGTGTVADKSVWLRGGQVDLSNPSLTDFARMGQESIILQLQRAGLSMDQIDVRWDDNHMGTSSTRMCLDTTSGRFDEYIASPPE